MWMVACFKTVTALLRYGHGKFLLENSFCVWYSFVDRWKGVWENGWTAPPPTSYFWMSAYVTIQMAGCFHALDWVHELGQGYSLLVQQPSMMLWRQASVLFSLGTSRNYYWNVIHLQWSGCAKVQFCNFLVQGLLEQEVMKTACHDTLSNAPRTRKWLLPLISQPTSWMDVIFPSFLLPVCSACRGRIQSI